MWGVGVGLGVGLWGRRQADRRRSVPMGCSWQLAPAGCSLLACPCDAAVATALPVPNPPTHSGGSAGCRPAGAPSSSQGSGLHGSSILPNAAASRRMLRRLCCLSLGHAASVLTLRQWRGRTGLFLAGRRCQQKKRRFLRLGGNAHLEP